MASKYTFEQFLLNSSYFAENLCFEHLLPKYSNYGLKHSFQQVSQSKATLAKKQF